MSTPEAAADAVTDAAAAAVRQPSLTNIENAVKAGESFVNLPAIHQTIADSSVAIAKTRRGVFTSEFWAAVAVVITDLTTDIGTKDKLVASLLAGAYAIARGLAKN